jgi:hypothetical protein
VLVEARRAKALKKKREALKQLQVFRSGMRVELVGMKDDRIGDRACTYLGEWQIGTLIGRQGEFHGIFQHDNVFEDEEGTQLLNEVVSLWLCRPAQITAPVDLVWKPETGDVVNARLPDDEDEDGIWWPCECLETRDVTPEPPAPITNDLTGAVTIPPTPAPYAEASIAWPVRNGEMGVQREETHWLRLPSMYNRESAELRPALTWSGDAAWKQKSRARNCVEINGPKPFFEAGMGVLVWDDVADAWRPGTVQTKSLEPEALLVQFMGPDDQYLERKWISEEETIKITEHPFEETVHPPKGVLLEYTDGRPYEENEYLVKWKHESYLQCEWVPEETLLASRSGKTKVQTLSRNRDRDQKTKWGQYGESLNIMQECNSKYFFRAALPHSVGITPEMMGVDRQLTWLKERHGYGVDVLAAPRLGTEANSPDPRFRYFYEEDYEEEPFNLHYTKVDRVLGLRKPTEAATALLLRRGERTTIRAYEDDHHAGGRGGGRTTSIASRHGTSSRVSKATATFDPSLPPNQSQLEVELSKPIPKAAAAGAAVDFPFLKEYAKHLPHSLRPFHKALWERVVAEMQEEHDEGMEKGTATLMHRRPDKLYNLSAADIRTKLTDLNMAILRSEGWEFLPLPPPSSTESSVKTYHGRYALIEHEGHLKEGHLVCSRVKTAFKGAIKTTKWKVMFKIEDCLSKDTQGDEREVEIEDAPPPTAEVDEGEAAEGIGRMVALLDMILQKLRVLKEELGEATLVAASEAVINLKDDNSLQVLTKWEQLPYSELTWEWASVVDKKLVEAHVARNDLKARKSCKAPRLPERSSFVKIRKSPTFGVKGAERLLRDYQLIGLNWLWFQWEQQRSCVLGDEMGLGKTAQSLSLLETLRTNRHHVGPIMIVVPLSTMGHWYKELQVWTPKLNIVQYHGSAEDRSEIRRLEFYYDHDADRTVKFHVLLTTYETCIQDVGVMGKFQWTVCILDEAHRLRNRESKIFKALMQFLPGKCFRLLMTGTPVQNNTEELWNLLHFMNQDVFPVSGKEVFMRDFGTVTESTQATELQRLLGPFLLRRVKTDVATDLPQKTETVIDVELTAFQKRY